MCDSAVLLLSLIFHIQVKNFCNWLNSDYFKKDPSSITNYPKDR